MAKGLNNDGGISFGREPKKKVKKEEAVKPLEQKRNADVSELATQERLSAKLRTAKSVNYTGFAVNGTTVISLLFYIDSLLVNPDVLDNLNMINDMFGLNINFENAIAVIQGYKAQIIGLAVSSQTMIMGYKDTVQKMKDRGDESFMNVINDELGKMGI